MYISIFQMHWSIIDLVIQKNAFHFFYDLSGPINTYTCIFKHISPTCGHMIWSYIVCLWRIALSCHYASHLIPDICHPTPADIVFILDSSLSMQEQQFRQQLQFVSNFTDHVHVGPHDLQISVIKFSTEAWVEFYLNDHPDNETLKDAIQKIKFKAGATLTDKGLNLVFCFLQWTFQAFTSLFVLIV